MADNPRFFVDSRPGQAVWIQARARRGRTQAEGLGSGVSHVPATQRWPAGPLLIAPHPHFHHQPKRRLTPFLSPNLADVTSDTFEDGFGA